MGLTFLTLLPNHSWVQWYHPFPKPSCLGPSLQSHGLSGFICCHLLHLVNVFGTSLQSYYSTCSKGLKYHPCKFQWPKQTYPKHWFLQNVHFPINHPFSCDFHLFLASNWTYLFNHPRLWNQVSMVRSQASWAYLNKWEWSNCMLHDSFGSKSQ